MEPPHLLIHDPFDNEVGPCPCKGPRAAQVSGVGRGEVAHVSHAAPFFVGRRGEHDGVFLQKVQSQVFDLLLTAVLGRRAVRDCVSAQAAGWVGVEKGRVVCDGTMLQLSASARQKDT